MNEKKKKILSKIMIAAIFYIIAIIISKLNFPKSNIISFVLFITAYIIV